jgi:hypothetical protein
MKLNHVENYLYLYLYIAVEKDEKLLGKIKKRGVWKIIYIYTDEKLLGKIKKGRLENYLYLYISVERDENLLGKIKRGDLIIRYAVTFRYFFLMTKLKMG